MKRRVESLCFHGIEYTLICLAGSFYVLLTRPDWRMHLEPFTKTTHAMLVSLNSCWGSDWRMNFASLVIFGQNQLHSAPRLTGFQNTGRRNVTLAATNSRSRPLVSLWWRFNWWKCWQLLCLALSRSLPAQLIPLIVCPKCQAFEVQRCIRIENLQELLPRSFSVMGKSIRLKSMTGIPAQFATLKSRTCVWRG